MAREPFQVLVFPYFIGADDPILYAVFQRSDAGYWQGIAGGGEDGETPIEAARRETMEESGIGPEHEFIRLDSMATIPAVGISGMIWGDDVLVVPQYCFGVRVTSKDIRLSHEHLAYQWLPYTEAGEILRWDSNKNALWELNYRLIRQK